MSLARVVTLALLVGLALGGVWVMQRWRLDRISEGAIERARERIAVPVAKRLHARQDMGVPYAQGVEEVFADLADVTAPWTDPELEPLFLRCAYVRDGLWPISDLPEPCGALVASTLPIVDQWLVTTRSPELGDPWCLHGAPFWVFATAATIASLQARAALEERDDPRAALEICIDLLGHWTDARLAARLSGSTSASSFVARAFRSCADALDRAAPRDKRWALEALQLIARDAPPLSRTVRTEAAFGELTLFGVYLSPADRRRLPQLGEAAVEKAFEYDPGGVEQAPAWLAPFVHVDAWSSYVDGMEAIAQAVDLGPDDAMQEIGRTLRDESLTPAVRAGLSGAWGEHYGAHHLALGRLHHLIAAALVDLYYAEHGRWPTDQQDLGKDFAEVRGARFRIAPGIHQATLEMTYKLPGDTPSTEILEVTAE